MDSASISIGVLYLLDSDSDMDTVGDGGTFERTATGGLSRSLHLASWSASTRFGLVPILGGFAEYKVPL
jgi:hypothetical protein